MAQFTAQGGVKSFFNVDAMYRFEIKDAFQFKIVRDGGGLMGFNGESRNRCQKRKIRFRGTTRIYTLSENKSSHLSNDGRGLDVDDDDDDARSGDDGYDDYDFLEFGNDDLSCFRGLILDVAYRPINVVCWKRAICLEFLEKADVLEYYDQTVNSPNGSFYIPAVLRVPHLLQFVKRQRIKNVLSRKNIFQRDNFTCQYCCSRENLTIDHVLPIARGGEWKWENLVAACSRCNSRKGQKTLEEASMKLLQVPMAPNDYDILSIPLTSSAISMLKLRKGTPEEWQQYLSKRSPLP